MRHTPWMVLVAAAVLAAGCATTNVSSHVERGIDFTTYTTYDWGPADALPTGDPRLDHNPFFRDYVTGAIERALHQRGYRLVSDGGPQLLIHYHANVSQRFEVHGVESYPNCYPNCEPSVAEYEEGTIVVDIMDAATNKLVWRGWAQDHLGSLIDSQDAMQKQIDQSIARMFRQFPQGRVPAGTPTR